MKYNAEVDSEKRNKSPRNDLLRNRKCVGIIQAAEAHTHTHRHVCVSTTTIDQFRCAQMPDPEVREQIGLNEPRRVAGSAVTLRNQATRKSDYFRGRSSTEGFLQYSVKETPKSCS